MMISDMYAANQSGRLYPMAERDVIKTTFSFLSQLNANDIKVLNKTEQLIYTMIAFLGDESAFLDENINALLSTFVKRTFSNGPILNLEEKFGDGQNFEHLYITFLDQFQGTSYGNKTFGILVLAPLQQRHNIKWRQMVWSEHIGVLRFISCVEKDVSYIKTIQIMDRST